MSNLLRCLFVCFGFIFSSSAFAAWLPLGTTKCEPTDSPVNNCGAYVSEGVIWRLNQYSSEGCPGGIRYQCQEWRPVGTSPCSGEEEWDQSSQQCVDYDSVCEEKAGEDAGLVENSPTAPGYEAICFSGCAVEVSEYFQRTDNDNWVIAYRYTGQACGDGDPLGEPDIPPGEEGPPPIGSNTPPDTDGDAIPDDNDPDIDGDGIPNSEDDDMDGDGIPDLNDPSPGGPSQQQPQSSANVGLDCRQAVACTGDGIQCAQLVELHRLRCAGSLDASDITDMVNNLDGLGDSMLQDAVDEQIEGIENGLSEFDDIADGPLSVFGEMIKGFFPQPVSCSDYVVAFPSPVGTQSFSCEKFDLFKLIYGWFLSVLVLIYVWHMAIQPVNK